jgi:protein-tyrosine-phosphatase
MAIGWLAVLQSVPWSDVVRNAPKVAAGAKKLWDNVANKSAANSDVAADGDELASAPVTLESLQQQVLTLQAASAHLQQRLVESSDLIGTLAEQNAQLIQGIQVLRRRLFWQGAALALVGLLAALATALALR